MARMPAPCGTFTAYKRHKRNGDAIDSACAQAARDQVNVRNQDKRDIANEVVRLAIVDAPPDPESLDELEELRWNLTILKATMNAGVASGMAALSKQHADLVAAITRLEAADKPGVSVLDQIAQRRADRIANTAT